VNQILVPEVSAPRYPRTDGSSFSFRNHGSITPTPLYTPPPTTPWAPVQVNAVVGSGKIPDFCYHRLRAQLILNHCKNQYVPYDGEFLRHMVIEDGVGAVNDGSGQQDMSKCAGVVSPASVPEASTDVVCKQTLPARKNAGVAVVGSTGRVFGSGGYAARGSFGADLGDRGALQRRGEGGGGGTSPGKLLAASVHRIGWRQEVLATM
jgi:hypothetical protein